MLFSRTRIFPCKAFSPFPPDNWGQAWCYWCYLLQSVIGDVSPETSPRSDIFIFFLIEPGYFPALEIIGHINNNLRMTTRKVP